jgi:hypothetical protein
MNRFSSVARATLLGSAVLLSSGIANAQSLAGPKPPAVQTGRDAGCIGELTLDGLPGAPRVADGSKTPPTWSIQSVYETPAVCSFPSARPVDVNCRRNGVNVDPVYCQESQFQSLLAQGYRTVGNSTNWSTAKWVLPGVTDSGCIAEWRTQDGETPKGCGDVNVPVQSTCVVTNVQSGTPDDPNKYCSAATRPSEFKVVKDFRSCGYDIQTGPWGAYSATCGDVTHDRPLTCVRGDGTEMAMSDGNCQTALSTFCSSQGHRCINVGGVIKDSEFVRLEACQTDDPNAYYWFTGGWISDGTTCGTDTQTRSVVCKNRATGANAFDDSCVGQERPASSQDVVVNTSCGKTAVCTGQSQVASWSDASSFGSYAAQCRTAGGDCVEQFTSRTTDAGGQPQTAYQSTCYSGGGNTPVGEIGPGDGPFSVHGVTVTNGTEGYCDYSAGAAGDRKCVKGAYPSSGCSSGIPSVTLSIPGKVRSGRGSVSITTGFGNADGTNGVEGSECKASSTITNNGETQIVEALGTFNSSYCIGSASANVGGTMYTVDVNVQVTPTSIGYDLSGVGTVEGVGCGTVAPPPPVTTPTPTPSSACYAAWGYIGYGPEDVYRDTVEITEDKIWSTGDPTWYVWAPGTYSTYNAFSLSRKNKSSSPALAFAVPAGAHLEIYSGPDLSGAKLMDVVGPKIIQKSGQTGRFTSSWTTDDWSAMPLMGQYAPSTRTDQAIASKPLLGSYAGSFKVSCAPVAPPPTPTPTPDPTSTPDGGTCVLGGSEAGDAATAYQSCINGMYSAGEAPLAYTLRNVDGSYTFCQSNQIIETQMCGENTVMWTGQGVCKRSNAQCVSSPTPTPTPVPTPTPTPSCTMATEWTGLTAGYCNPSGTLNPLLSISEGDYRANSLDGEAFRQQCYAAGGNCVDYNQTTYTSYEGVNEGYNESYVCYKSDNPQSIGGGTCFANANSSGCSGFMTPTGTPSCTAPTPTPVATPTPTPTPTPVSTTPISVTAGYCRYTSSGGGRHACGEWAQGLTYSNVVVPGPKDFCTGNLIAGYEASYIIGQSTSPPDPLGMDWSTRSNYHWGIAPTLRDVPGAKCVFSWKTGYSGEWKNDQPFWVSAYYDGPPTGTQGQTWIKK